MCKRILAFITALMLMLALLAGCGSAKSQSSPRAAEQKSETSKADGVEKNSSGSMEKQSTNKFTATADKYGNKLENVKGDIEVGEATAETASDSDALIGTNVPTSAVSNDILAQRKIIRNANVSIEVEDFDKAYGQIGSIISGIGIVQDSNVRKEKIYIDSKEKLVTSGVIVIRVYADRFESVLKNLKGIGLLIDESIKGEDITDKFFDTESRLRVLKIEYDRVEEYLKRVNDPDIIFKTQARLSELRLEIERLTGTLNKWKDLVELSTITINMSEKRDGSGIPVISQKSFFSRLSGGFLESVKSTFKVLGEFLIFVAQALPVLILLAIFLAIALRIYRKFFKKKLSNASNAIDH